MLHTVASRSLLVLLALVLAGCTAPLPAGGPTEGTSSVLEVPDPLRPGSLAVTRHEYEFGVMVVDDPTLVPYRYTVPLHGSLHLPDGDRPTPLVVLMHGRHGTCAVLGVEGIGTGACPNAMVVTPVNSYTGYDALAETLASHGYAVASIDANTINDRDLVGDSGANARGQLILRTLDELASVNATGQSTQEAPPLPAIAPRTEVPEAKGRLDLSRVGLMGHSRGGEGVARAVSLDADANGGAHGLDAIFALAPTNFARWPVAGVPFATLLPYCDGDVSNLQGAWMYDDARRLTPAAPRHQILAMGANHNFYNTVWTGDDWGTTGAWCGTQDDGSGRDTPDQQRAHGYGLMASFFRFYVGGETSFAPLWDGTASWPDSFCPDRAGCADRLFASHFPVRRLDLAPNGVPTILENIKVEACEPAACPSQPTYAGMRLAAWTCEPGGRATFPLATGLTGWSAFSLRVGGRDGAAVWLEAVPGAAYPAIQFPPRPGGDDAAKTVMSEVRIPFGLPDADLAGVASLVLHCDGPGTVQATDLMLV